MGITMCKRIRSIVLPALAAAFLSAVAIPASADQIISLRSGNGAIGSLDSAVSMLIGPPDSEFVGAFTPTQFSDARTGPQASIIANHSSWLPPSLFSDTAARWISTGPGGATLGNTALFAIDFTITDAVISSADIVFNFAVDNSIGGVAPNQGLYLNGTALSGSTSVSGFTAEHSLLRTDIAPLLVSGLNTLYINMTDAGGPSGLIFSTTITTVGSAAEVPEPGLIAIFALGLAGLGFGRWAHNRRI